MLARAKPLAAALGFAAAACLFQAPLAGADNGRDAEFRAALADRLAARLRTASAGERDALAVVAQFYERRSHASVWIEDGRPSERGRALLATFARADNDGLRPADYAVSIPAGADPAVAADLEIALAHALIRYGCDLRAGRVEPDHIDRGLYVARAPASSCDALDGTAAAPDVEPYLRARAPRTSEYARLRDALARYRARAGRRDWPSISPGPALQLGMTDRRVVELRRALAEHGDGTGETAGDLEAFDPDLEAAVGRFQARHGLAADGVFGPATRAAFNVPVETRIAQFVLNMERRRWMPDDLGRRHVLVNLAGFMLAYVDGSHTVFETRVIVGTTYQRSPLFSATMTGFELNPHWHVTDNIARNEMLPAIRREIGYLADNDLRVLDFRDGQAFEVDPESVAWSTLGPDRFPYLLRQEPGPRNALGRIKFLMPNRWDVYLHDTPAQELFEQSVRSFSHGCIRVQNPFELAAALLGPEGAWTAHALEERALNGERVSIRLPAPVPVHLAYVTAWVDQDGQAHFRRDIYGRDRRLAAALGLGAVIE